MKKGVIQVIIVCLALTVVSVLYFLDFAQRDTAMKQADATPQVAVTLPDLNPMPVPQPSYLTFGAVGDHLLHISVIRDSKQSDGTHDFLSMYETVVPLIQSVDVAMVNQEAPISSAHSPSGYPTFNSPLEAAQNLVDAGFDVINQANNHSMDKGESGVLSTIETWNNYPQIEMIGMYASQEERDKVETITKNDITLGFLSYTEQTNGLPVPSDAPYLVPLIEDDVIAEEVVYAKDRCDVLIASIHWGHENWLEPNDEQIRVAEMLNELGVDVIIGHHPHVIQPIEMLTSDTGHQTLVIYSLGNFISAQDRPNTMLGIFAHFTIKKDIDGTISYENITADPIITHYKMGWHTYSARPLELYTDELANTHSVRQHGDVSPEYYENLMTKVLGDYYKK